MSDKLFHLTERLETLVAVVTFLAMIPLVGCGNVPDPAEPLQEPFCHEGDKLTCFGSSSSGSDSLQIPSISEDLYSEEEAIEYCEDKAADIAGSSASFQSAVCIEGG